MVRYNSLPFLGLAFFVSGGIGAAAPSFVPGEYVVKFHPSFSTMSVNGLQKTFSSSGFALQKPVGTHDDLFLVRQVQGGWQSQSQDSKLEALRKLPNVDYVEPNFIYHASQSVPAAVPNDPLFPSLWGMNNVGQTIQSIVGKAGADIKAAQAWAISKGSSSVIVGVIDTGVDYNHPDLKANIWSSPDDPNVHGYNAITGALDPMDDDEHGTHVSGTIGAVGDNNVGVVGVNWSVRIMGCKFLNKKGEGTLEGAIKAIDWCVDHGAQVLNNSWGGGGFSQALQDSIQHAADKGVLFVAASGNEYADNDARPSYPSSYPLANVVSVAASTNTDTMADFSNSGSTSVHLMAPGENIYSTIPGGGYEYMSGTSMATPHVAGAAALLLSKEPSLTPPQLKARLMSSTDKIPSVRAHLISGGRLNLYNLLANINPPGFADIPENSWVQKPVAISTEHPYPINAAQTWTIEEPGATFVKVHITKFETEAHFDRLRIISGTTGEVVATLSGIRATDFWTPAVDGPKMILEFVSDTSVNGYGFDIDAYKFTTVSIGGLNIASGK